MALRVADSCVPLINTSVSKSKINIAGRLMMPVVLSTSVERLAGSLASCSLVRINKPSFADLINSGLNAPIKSMFAWPATLLSDSIGE